MTIVPSKKRPKSEHEGRTLLNLITQFDLKYQATTLALGLTSVHCDNSDYTQTSYTLCKVFLG